MAKAGFSLVGLDIGSSGIRAVQLRSARKSAQPQIARAAWVDLAPGIMHEGVLVDPQALTKALRQLWRSGGFTRHKVAFAVPAPSVLTRQLDLPWMQPADFRSALRYQVIDALPMDIDSVELDYHLLERRSRAGAKAQAVDENRILVVAAEREQTTAIARAISQAKLEPVIADHAPLALIRAMCQGQVPEGEQARAIVDIGAEQMTVAIQSQGQPLFIRVLSPGGGSGATQEIAAELGIDIHQAEQLKVTTELNVPVPVLVPVAESSVFSAAFDSPASLEQAQDSRVIATMNSWASTVVTEIRNSLDYYRSDENSAAVTELTIVGRAASMPGLVERIATQLPYPITSGQPWMGLPGGERLKHQPADARLALAIGLATARVG
ncbi:MAG: type IV pilus assembly protein PilM [Actinomycetota bacterium]|nr:type IV pilus assembly protein PilM [Actinomycetota bacterium]MDP2289395.1 type IV pilus assembly protein PilM [Actinomycetota bacterium]